MTGRTLFLTALAVLAGGCTTETTAATDTGPTGVPLLSLVSVNGVATPPDGLCVAVAEAPDPVFPIVVSTTDPISGKLTMDLRPPGYCSVAAEVNCGHLVVLVNGHENSTSTTTTVMVHLGKLANHYADLAITVEAVDDKGVVLNSDREAGTGKPLSVTARVTTMPSCPNSDAGADGG